MVSAFVPGSSGPDLNPGRGYCVVFLHGQDTLLSQCLSPHRSIKRYQRIIGETKQIAGELLTSIKFL